MKLYFVRHGETEWNVKKKIQGKTDIPLNENGIRQQMISCYGTTLVKGQRVN